MISKKRRNIIFLEAAILTFVIYLFALILNGYLDDKRVEQLDYEMINASIEFDNMIIAQNFYEKFNSTNCDKQKDFINNNFKNLKLIGSDLNNFGQLFLEKNNELSLIKQREYFLKELSLYGFMYNYNQMCENETIVPLIYFFNSKNTNLDKQSLILEQFSRNYENETIIFSFDINYNDEPLLNLIKNKYNITFSPFIIIGNKTTRNLNNQNLIVDLNAITIEYKKIRGEI